MTPGDTTTTAIIAPARRAVWRYVGGLAPVVLLWAALAGWLASQLYDRANWSDEADRATIREWLDETRTFRQSLPELARDYSRISPDDVRRQRNKRDEIEEQMRALVEPTRLYANQLPSFPEIYSLTIAIGEPAETIAWTSPLPRPKQSRVPTLVYKPFDDANITITCEYHLHALNRLKQSEENRRQTSFLAAALLVTATILAGLFVWRFLQREHAREIERLTAIAAKQHRERELLEAKTTAGELKGRAVEAEKNALEIKSQIYASIGIMAGSYAHNIKNLLVRPNDLLARCLEAGGDAGQHKMLAEVKATLATVTDRLQQILSTVRRDPQQSQTGTLDLNALAKETVATWHDTAFEKWKLALKLETSEGVLPIVGDASHLQQALENLLFNARDATFEMRNYLREQARQDVADRKQRILAAAAWKGEVTLVAKSTPGGPVLEVHDNGIGMTAEVKARCLETHFSTKRDNALYEGHAAGMGLGLSFVAMVLEQHGATLAIDSTPHGGTTFRVQFSKTVPAESHKLKPTHP